MTLDVFVSVAFGLLAFDPRSGLVRPVRWMEIDHFWSTKVTGGKNVVPLICVIS